MKVPKIRSSSLWTALALLLLVACSEASREATNIGAADDVTAFNSALKLAEEGQVEWQRNVGYRYYFGEGVKGSKIQAATWYRRAAEKGDAESQWRLGLLFDKGEGVPEDSVEAAKWYLLAANQGHADAQVAIGYCYARGHGVRRDDVQAYKWYNLAAAQGNADGVQSKKVAVDRMTRLQIDEAQRQSSEWKPTTKK